MSSSINGRHGSDMVFAYTGIVLAVVIIALISWLVLRGAGAMRCVLGVNGVNNLSRVMGFLLICIGGQFAINGVRDLAADADFCKLWMISIERRSMHMKHTRSAVIAFCVFLAVQGSVAQERGFGLGVIIGEPTGISAKLWTSPVNAFDFGLGWSIGGDRIGKYKGRYDGGSRVHFHMDYLWHAFEAIHSSERFPLYYGFGGRINSGAGYDGSVAIRGVFGIAWLPHTTPIDVFLELVPSLQLTSSTGLGVDAGIGARYFF